MKSEKYQVVGNFRGNINFKNCQKMVDVVIERAYIAEYFIISPSFSILLLLQLGFFPFRLIKYVQIVLQNVVKQRFLFAHSFPNCYLNDLSRSYFAFKWGSDEDEIFIDEVDFRIYANRIKATGEGAEEASMMVRGGCSYHRILWGRVLSLHRICVPFSLTVSASYMLEGNPITCL